MCGCSHEVFVHTVHMFLYGQTNDICTVALIWDVCCVVHRCVDHHWWYTCWRDEARRAGGEGLRPEQLHAGPDRSYWSSNVGYNSQQGCSGAFRGTITTFEHMVCLLLLTRLITCTTDSPLLPSSLSSSSSSMSVGLFPSALFAGRQGPGPALLPR